MMGFGGYVNGGSYPSPSSSNLSASAPPFTLDRSPKPGPIPLTDLIEPSSYSGPMNSSLANWLSSRPPNSELNSPSNAYGYGGLQAVEPSSTVVSAPAEPYHPPPYVSPVAAAQQHKDSSFVIVDQAGYDWSSFSRAPVRLDCSSADDYRQRLSDSKYGAEWNGDGLWNGFVDWKQGIQSHRSFNSKEPDITVPSMYEHYMNPDRKIIEDLGRVEESSTSADFLEMGKFGGSLNAEKSDEKPFSGKTPSFVPDDFSRSVLGSLSGISETQLRPPSLVFCPTSSASHEGYVQDFHYFQNEPILSSSKLRIYPERDDPNPDDASQDAAKAKSGPGLFNSGCDRFSLDLNINEAMISAAQETVDHYNHGVDSPCWKGVPANHSSPFNASEAGSEVGKLENNSNCQSKQAFRQNSDENTMSPIARAGDHSETVTAQRSDDIYKYESGSSVKNPGVVTQSLQEGEVVNDIIEEALQYCSARLHVPVENAVSSSVEDSSRTDRNAASSGPSIPTIDVSGLVDTIHNLSNFLMYHCTRGASQLKQNDLDVVHRVIDNLGMCTSKKAEKMAPSQEPFFSVKNAHDFPGSLQKAVVDDQSGNKGTKFSISAKFDEVADLLSEGRECNVVDEDKVTLALKKVLTENFDEDEEKGTEPQSLLYKNLWLEAEAALCSVNYKARYNRMKIEMEGSKLLKSKEAHENSADTETKKPQGSAAASPDYHAVETFSPKDEACSASKSRGLSALSPSSHDDDVMARLQILRCRIENSNPGTPANAEKPSSSSAAASLPEEKASPKLETSLQASIDLGANRDINDFDASVMARFHIIKSRAENFPPPQEKEEMKLPRFASQSTYYPILSSILETGSSGPNPNNDRFTPNEFQMYDPHGQSQGPEGSVAQVGGYERVSPDWEHVRKEDLSWQHRY